MIKTFYFNDLRTCCYLLYDETGECAIVDPGCYKESEKERLVRFIESNSLVPKMILQTHGHFDHVMGNAFVTEKWHIPTYIASADIREMRRARTYSAYFGYEFDEPSNDIAEIGEGEIIRVGNMEFKVMASPGHTPGGVLFYNEKEKYLIAGDTIFQGSIGRTDLPRGNYDDLIESIKTKIVPLPADTVIYPGHGPATSVAEELLKNPFLSFLS